LITGCGEIRRKDFKKRRNASTAFKKGSIFTVSFCGDQKGTAPQRGRLIGNSTRRNRKKKKKTGTEEKKKGRRSPSRPLEESLFPRNSSKGRQDEGTRSFGRTKVQKKKKGRGVLMRVASQGGELVNLSV